MNIIILRAIKVKILSAEGIPINYKTQTANTSVRISVLPSKLPKLTTAVVWDSVNPQYNQEFTFSLARAELAGKVVKVVVTDHERPGGAKKVIGLAVVSLDTAGLLSEGELEGEGGGLRVREVWLSVQTKISQELANLLSDRSDDSIFLPIHLDFN